MKIKEIEVKSVLEKVNISEYSDLTGPGIDYTVDPYLGCAHACKYCYVFREQFLNDPEHGKDMWGDFVDPKINCAEILSSELKTAKRGTVLLSSLTDPYQPLEHQYRLTRKCLEILQKYNFRIAILTKSDLVNRDLDILSKFNNADIGLTITTDDDSIRQIIEPNSSSIDDRIATLKNFHSRKINTYAHIGPILPMEPEELVNKIAEHIDYAIIDRMNYIDPELEELYQRNGFGYALGEDYFKAHEGELKKLFEKENIRIW